jgi:hypothetical protein
MWIRKTFVPRESGTQTSPNATAAGNGLDPTRSVCTTRFVAGSIRDTVPPKALGTKTVPSAATAGFDGLLPTLIVTRIRPVRGSSLVTVPLIAFATQPSVPVTASVLGST